MALEVRIVDPLDARVAFEEFGDSQSGLVLFLHPQREGLEAPQEQVAAVGINRAAHGDVTGEAAIPLFQGGGVQTVKNASAPGKPAKGALASMTQAAQAMMGSKGQSPDRKDTEGIVKEFFHEPSIALRLGCFGIDMVLLLIFRIIALYGLGLTTPTGASEWAVNLFFSVPVIPAVIGFGMCWRLLGASPGQLILGIRVVDQSGVSLDWETAFKRSLYFTISTCLFGLGALVYFSEEGETAFDLFAKTKVIERPKDQ